MQISNDNPRLVFEVKPDYKSMLHIVSWDDPEHPLKPTMMPLNTPLSEEEERGLRKAIAQNLRDAINDAGLTITALSAHFPTEKKYGVTSQYLGRLLNDPFKLTYRQVNILQWMLHCSLDYLRGASAGRDIDAGAVSRETVSGFLNNMRGQSYADASRVVRALRLQDIIVNGGWFWKMADKANELEKAINPKNYAATSILIEMNRELWRLFDEATRL